MESDAGESGWDLCVAEPADEMCSIVILFAQ